MLPAKYTTTLIVPDVGPGGVFLEHPADDELAQIVLRFAFNCVFVWEHLPAAICEELGKLWAVLPAGTPVVRLLHDWAERGDPDLAQFHPFERCAYFHFGGMNELPDEVARVVICHEWVHAFMKAARTHLPTWGHSMLPHELISGHFEEGICDRIGDLFGFPNSIFTRWCRENHTKVRTWTFSRTRRHERIMKYGKGDTELVGI